MFCANVKVCNFIDSVQVRITSPDKPAVDENTKLKWTRILNLLSKTIDIPSSLVMQMEEKMIKVFAKSMNKENPYEVNEKAELLSGLYCETVVGTGKKLLIDNALKYDYWKNNPDVELNMISYLGFPLFWPDGEIFGTICVLDSKENAYNDNYLELLKEFKISIETDLLVLMERNLIFNCLENALKSKRNFINNMNHEINTPLNKIIGYTNLILKNHSNNDEFRDHILKINEGGYELNDILNSILNVSEIETNKVKLNPDQIRLQSSLSTIIKRHKKSIEDKNIEIEIKNRDVLGDFIYHDSKILSVIIDNLLCNAIKFNKKNGKVTISSNKSDTDFTLVIKDNGIGIDLDNYDTLFEKFTIEENIYRKSFKGIGLGLYIVRKLVDIISGNIKIKSEKGKGTEIIIRFPLIIEETEKELEALTHL